MISCVRLNKYRLLASFIATLLLQACATGPTPVPADLVLDQREQQLMALNNWQFSGKLGVKAPSESASLYINWRQQQQNFSIDLQGPLGQGSAKMAGNKRQATLEHDGETYRAANAEALVQERFGWQLPVAQLKYWVRALPTPEAIGEREIHRDAQGLLLSQSQQGWQMHYSHYQWVGEQALPGKIKAESEALGVRLILVINNWQLNSEE